MGSSELNAAAQTRAKELSVNYSYTRPDGSREFTVLSECGVSDITVGENYWAAAQDPADVVAAWNSYSFFKERMLNKDATTVGIGYYEGGEYGNYWVMIFTYARNTSENSFAKEVLDLVNVERTKRGLNPWQWAMQSCRLLPMSALWKWLRSHPIPVPMAPTASPF